MLYFTHKRLRLVCAEMARRFFVFCFFKFSQTIRGIFTQTDESRAGADVISLDDGRGGDL